MRFRDYLSVILIVLLAISVSATAVVYASYEKKLLEVQQEPVSFGTPANFGDVTLESAIETTEEATEETTEEIENTTEETTPAARYVESPDNSQIYFTNYRFSTVEPDYFHDALFIGNSRLQGFVLYSKLPDLRSYTYIGLSVLSYFTKNAFTINGVDMTTAQAIEAESGYNKVYLKFGINELGWLTTDQFIEAYSKIIEHIYSCNPNAMIFVNAVLPVSERAIANDPSLSREKVIEYNNALKDMAAKYNACFLDVASAFTDENGYLPHEMSFDGIHLTADSVQIWLQYFLEHGIEEN